MKAAKLLLMILAVVAVVPMYGQSAAMKVNIPFAFSVDNHQMPSGDYEIRPLTENTLLIRTTNGAAARVSLTSATGGGVNYYKAPSLEFKKVNEQYFLSAAFFGEVIGRRFARTKVRSVPEGEVVISQAASN
jgi:hypothetical protein